MAKPKLLIDSSGIVACAKSGAALSQLDALANDYDFVAIKTAVDRAHKTLLGNGSRKRYAPEVSSLLHQFSVRVVDDPPNGHIDMAVLEPKQMEAVYSILSIVMYITEGVATSGFMGGPDYTDVRCRTRGTTAPTIFDLAP
ncbi:MAG: hypothetical protein DHS20C14_15880 [Phycisphaeraceae bacterium]|nr:MAG: hypothetical protein DHS20C14_15880 [Phycisphaeraceae bacterium]